MAPCVIKDIDIDKLGEVHSNMNILIEHTRHLNQLESIDNSICQLGESITVLSSQQKDIMRWLLVVVCAIALGKGAIEVFQSVITKGHASEVSSTQN